MAYLVTHTFNRNGIYTGGKPNRVPLMKKVSLINRSAKRPQRLKSQHCFPFKTNRRQCDFECRIHGVINSGKIEGMYFGSICSIF